MISVVVTKGLWLVMKFADKFLEMGEGEAYLKNQPLEASVVLHFDYANMLRRPYYQLCSICWFSLL